MRISLLTTGLLLAAAILPASSQAATVSVEGDTLVYRAAPGERNGVQLNGSWNPEGRLRLSDVTADITALPGTCTARDVDMVDCDVPGRVRVELGDGDDSVGFGESYKFSIPVEVLGGDGSDRLHGNHYAAGPERLDGGPGKDGIDGFGGDDEILGGDGRRRHRGQRGQRPGPRRRRQRHAGRRRPGRAGRGRHRRRRGLGHRQGLRRVRHGRPPARRRQPRRRRQRRPRGRGRQRRRHRALHRLRVRSVRADRRRRGLAGLVEHELRRVVVVAGGGDDKITGEDAVETIDGGAGNDRLEGGKNHDTITGGPGADIVFGDDTDATCNANYVESCVLYGNDVIDVRDGERDQVDCGAGADRVSADALDVVSANCEAVDRGAAGGGAGPGAGAAQTGAAAGVGAASTPKPFTLAGPAKLRTVLRKGLTLRLRNAEPGTQRIVARHAGRVVASARVKVARTGTATAKLRFTRSARRSLARKRSVRLAISGAGLSGTVTLKR
jgi:hypothetical protein